MKSGERIGGKRDKVGQKLVLIRSSQALNFSTAVADLDNIAAVAVRAKTK